MKKKVAVSTVADPGDFVFGVFKDGERHRVDNSD